MQKMETRNDLFKRNEVEIEISAEKNPTFDEAKKMLAEQMKKPTENINVSGIKGHFGSNLFVISAYVYDSKEDLENSKQLTQKQKKAEAEESAKAKESAKLKTPAENPVETAAEEKN